MPHSTSVFKSLWCFSGHVAEPDGQTREDNFQNHPQATRPNDSNHVSQTRRLSHSSHSSDTTATDAYDLLEQLRAMKLRNFRTLKDVGLKSIRGKPTNDRSYLMERIIQLTTDLPYRSPNSQTLTKSFLTQLWDDLEHPPKSYLGNRFSFRQADGSMNNILWPHVGAAGQPYARTVRPKMMQPVARPDPGVLFDTLLLRKAFKPHPNSISSVLFYLASIIIHDIFHTSHTDFTISETSSYLDLAPLYGSSRKQQQLVRTMKDGKLRADCFSDARILGFPPGVGVLLIFFNRFHNRVAEDLAKIDENGRFSCILHPPGRPAPTNGEELYDEALFQTARLVTTGLYINIVLLDYVRTILNLNSVNSKWNLDPRSKEPESLIRNKIPTALGNQVAAEFNLVYRWHSCISERDEQWTEAAYKRITGDSANLSISELLISLQRWAEALPTEPQKRPFLGLERDAGGRLPDDKLASIWTHSVEDVAGSFGPRHVPPVMRAIEMLGIIQARTWNLASLNEFREYFELSPHKTFEDINPDPIIAEQLQNLYGHPDHVELYPGIIVEEAKKSLSPGSGLCTNFTVSRAILSDAVGLVRGDRFHTIDHTPQNLTNFGFQASNYDVSVDYGCVFRKLVLNALPDHFTANSIYAHYPLVTPNKNQQLLEDLKQSQFYDFRRPESKHPLLVLSICTPAPSENLNISQLWSERRVTIGGPVRAVKLSAKKNGPSWVTQMTQQQHWGAVIRTFFEEVVQHCWKTRQYSVGGHQQIEILRDVINTAYAEMLMNILNVSEGDLHEIGEDLVGGGVQNLISKVFDFGFGADLTTYFQGGQRKQVVKLAAMIETKIGHARKSSGRGTDAMVQQGQVSNVIRQWGQDAMVNFTGAGLSPQEITWDHMLPVVALIMVSATRMTAQCIEAMLARKLKLVWKDDTKFVQQLTAERTQLTFTTKAAMPSGVSDEQQTVVYNLSGVVRAFSPEMEMVEELHQGCMRAILGIFGRSEGLEAVQGPQGQLKQVRDKNGTILYLDEKQSEYSHCPTMLMVRWMVVGA